MKFTPQMEADLLAMLADYPAECIVYPIENYRDDYSILIHRDQLTRRLHRYLYEQVFRKLERYEFLLPLSHACWHGVICLNPYHKVVSKYPHWRAAEGAMTRKLERERKIGPRRPNIADINRAKTHCPRGHPLTPDNVYTHVDKKGRRHHKCKRCTLTRTRAARAANRKES